MSESVTGGRAVGAGQGWTWIAEGASYRLPDGLEVASSEREINSKMRF